MPQYFSKIILSYTQPPSFKQLKAGVLYCYLNSAKQIILRCKSIEQPLKHLAKIQEIPLTETQPFFSELKIILSDPQNQKKLNRQQIRSLYIELYQQKNLMRIPPIMLHSEPGFKRKCGVIMNTILGFWAGVGTITGVIMGIIDCIPTLALAEILEIVGGSCLPGISAFGATVIGGLLILALPSLIVGIYAAKKMFNNACKKNAEERTIREQINKYLIKLQLKIRNQSSLMIQDDMHFKMIMNDLLALSLIKQNSYYLRKKNNFITFELMQLENILLSKIKTYLQKNAIFITHILQQKNSKNIYYKAALELLGQSHPGFIQKLITDKNDLSSLATEKNSSSVSSLYCKLIPKKHETKQKNNTQMINKIKTRCYSFAGGLGMGLGLTAIILAFTGMGIGVIVACVALSILLGIGTCAVEYYFCKDQDRRIAQLHDDKHSMKRILKNTQDREIQLLANGQALKKNKTIEWSRNYQKIETSHNACVSMPFFDHGKHRHGVNTLLQPKRGSSIKI